MQEKFYESLTKGRTGGSNIAILPNKFCVFSINVTKVKKLERKITSVCKEKTI